MRVDLMPGADHREMPKFGYGRIRNSASTFLYVGRIWNVGERYWTVCVAGWRLFIARGNYTGYSRSMRCWLRRFA